MCLDLTRPTENVNVCAYALTLFRRDEVITARHAIPFVMNPTPEMKIVITTNAVKVAEE